MMDLKDEILGSIRNIARQHHIGKVILFGSRARGDNRERSDIDLAVSGGDVMRFSFDVDEYTPTLLMFDVVDLDSPVQQELLDEIRRDGIVIYEEDDELPESLGKSGNDTGKETAV